MSKGTFTRLVLGLVALGLAATEPQAADVDTTQLPRTSDAKELFASPGNTIFTTAAPVATVSETTTKSLIADGWQEFVAPHAERAKIPNMAMHTLKRGGQGLNVYIAVAPAQANATAVNYSVLPLANDLPFPKDAKSIEFDPNRPELLCTTSAGVRETVAFYQSQLPSFGWMPWLGTGAVKAQEPTDESGSVYFVRGQQKALELVVTRQDGGSKVTLLDTPYSLLVAKVQPEDAKKESKPATTAPPAADAFDALASDMLRQAQKIANDAIAEATQDQPRKANDKQPAETPETLQARTDTKLPLPVPSSADSIVHDWVGGTLEYDSASSVAALAKFHREAMKSLGWLETPSVINKPNMVVLEFSKEDQDLSLTLMKVGAASHVSGNGSALVKEDQKSIAAEADTDTNTADHPQDKALMADDLLVDEGEGLPVPKQHSMAGHSSTPFRIGAEASVPAGVEAVLGFYRRELAKRDWKEESASTVVKPDAATAKFVTPEGPAVLTLAKKGDETSVELTLRKEVEAKKSGLMPSAGKARIVMGNILETDSSITIDKQTIKVKAQSGSKGPDGPSVELSPGHYTYIVKSKGKPEQKDNIEVRDGEIWGVLVGPGGGLALPMY